MTLPDETARPGPATVVSAAPELSTEPDGPDLVALVGSRIAHDLNNPIGAIANGVELLGLTGTADGPELGLITESVENARRRIKTFRIAFGAAAPGARIGAAEIGELAAPGADGRRLEVDWPLTEDLPRAEAKAVFLALMCLESAMPWGGRAAVRGGPGGWRIDAAADRMRVDPGLWGLLEGAPVPADLAANAVHFALLARETRGRNRPIATGFGDTAIRLAF